MLLSVRALPEGEEFADDRVIVTVREISPCQLRFILTSQLRLMNFICFGSGNSPLDHPPAPATDTRWLVQNAKSIRDLPVE